jgi:uncharacterized protein GlcG (DUF336 family)
MTPSYSEQLTAEVIRLFPQFLADPLDWEKSHGNGALAVIEDDGTVRGHLFGEDRTVMRRLFGIANRKVIQVWCTGYATGHFESLVFSGQLDEGTFGVDRPDFIGWKGGVPLQTAEGRRIAAAFSGIRGEKDVEIVERAAAAVPGLMVVRN